MKKICTHCTENGSLTCFEAVGGAGLIATGLLYYREVPGGKGTAVSQMGSQTRETTVLAVSGHGTGGLQEKQIRGWLQMELGFVIFLTQQKPRTA